MINATHNGSMAEQCAWASLNVSGIGWLNATVGLHESGRALLLHARLPALHSSAVRKAVVVGSRYGWGPIPMLSVYDAETDLPVLPWQRALPAKVPKARK